ncbi:MAG: FAD-dependent oxidoreductase [Rhodothermaceae bacterium]|nr:FAD-dependent oxidoreductase [Rhodothermaceae bacterium]MYF63539.1 FAD-dependent oxidoreductase [Rhodothermaceae bacterium]MYI84046.1 FAD-dependent oxidoreductase [Rhodothermaceae bacterium]
MHSPDVIVIGAGTNGLAAAAALAKAGVDTLVLEKRAHAGGLSSYHAFTPENHIPGFRPYPGRIGAALSKALGIALPEQPVVPTNGFWNEEIYRVKPVPDLRDAGSVLKTIVGVPLEQSTLRQKSSWVTPSLKKQAKNLAQWIPLSSVDLLNELNLDENQCNALAIPPSARSFAAPKSPFGALQLMLHEQDLTTDGHAPLLQQLEKVAISNGATIRTNAEVEQIFYDANGLHVMITGGEPIYSRFILATCSPGILKHRLMSPVLTHHWPPVRARGTCAVLALAVDRLPDWLDSARVRVSPDLITQERAFDHVKYGRIPPLQSLEIVAAEGQNTVVIYALQTPFDVSGGWTQSNRESLVAHILEQVPDLSSNISTWKLWSPPDIATEFGVPGGHPLHFERDLDQLLFPAPYCLPTGVYWSGHFANRELGEAGIAGLLAARKILRKRNRRR